MNREIVLGLTFCLFAIALIPTAGATAAGACVSHCAWTSTETNHHSEVEVYNCSAAGNIAVIFGDENEVNYCSKGGNGWTIG